MEGKDYSNADSGRHIRILGMQTIIGEDYTHYERSW